MRLKARVLDVAPWACETPPTVQCPECGYVTHLEANVRGDGAMCCPKCYTVFDLEEPE